MFFTLRDFMIFRRKKIRITFMSVIESMRIEVRGRKMANPDLNRTKLSVIIMRENSGWKRWICGGIIKLLMSETSNDDHDNLITKSRKTPEWKSQSFSYFTIDILSVKCLSKDNLVSTVAEKTQKITKWRVTNNRHQWGLRFRREQIVNVNKLARRFNDS